MATALYRKYRPANFAEVAGQEHVTEPLRTALAAQRVNHAYLFSGPRGCGKTSSARILARSLNCAQGPTADPCGECESCVALAPEGPGSVDVVELDAASHGGVDDTRELRDRAFYAPAQSRYRIFVIDEAHMVTPQGFNALLKIVEEPPEHLVFVFATTEPDKVLTTIRSRTHHYPFRLMPPGVMRELLERVCAEEDVPVEPAVFPLVVRAGGGSARDTLSVLDQLLAGAGPEGITHERAVALLGVTDSALLDEMVDALAAGDGATAYGAVDRLVEAGHDPRRFASDLLDRLRDLVLLHTVPDAAERGLVDVSGDQLTKMQAQSEQLGAGTLTRFGELVHNGLSEMRGATAPRLLLELLVSRMLLPAVSDSEAALLQRLERVERRMTIAPAEGGAAGEESGGSADSGKRVFQRPSQQAAAQRDQQGAGQQGSGQQGSGQQSADRPAAGQQDSGQHQSGQHQSGQSAAGQQAAPQQASSGPAANQRAAAPSAPAQPEQPAAHQQEAHQGASEPQQSAPRQEERVAPAPETTSEATPEPPPETTQTAPESAPAAPSVPQSGGPDAADVRRVWTELLRAVAERNRPTQALLLNATVQDLRGGVLVLSMPTAGLVKQFAQQHRIEFVKDAMRAVLGGEWDVQCVEAGSAEAQPQARGARGKQPQQAHQQAQQRAQQQAQQQAPQRPSADWSGSGGQQAQNSQPQNPQSQNPRSQNPQDEQGGGSAANGHSGQSGARGRDQSGGSGPRGRGSRQAPPDDDIPPPDEPPPDPDEEPPPDEPPPPPAAAKPAAGSEPGPKPDPGSAAGTAGGSAAELADSQVAAPWKDPQEAAVELFASELGARRIE